MIENNCFVICQQLGAWIFFPLYLKIFSILVPYEISFLNFVKYLRLVSLRADEQKYSEISILLKVGLYDHVVWLVANDWTTHFSVAAPIEGINTQSNGEWTKHGEIPEYTSKHFLFSVGAWNQLLTARLQFGSWCHEWSHGGFRRIRESNLGISMKIYWWRHV